MRAMVRRWRLLLAAAVVVVRGAKVTWPERAVCAAAHVAAYAPTAPKRVAVIFRGESFRNVGGQHMRGTCCAMSVRQQRVIWESHVALFGLLEAEGYAVDVFSATRPCTSANPRLRNATDALRTWYAGYLRGWAEDALDREPFSQLRNRRSGVALAKRFAERKRANYAHVLVLRWDYVVHARHWDAGCVLDGALRDARDLLPREHDADKMFAIPGKFSHCFFASIVEDVPSFSPASLRSFFSWIPKSQAEILAPDPRGGNYTKRIARPPRCQWDGCIEAMDRGAGGGHRAATRCAERWTNKLIFKLDKHASAEDRAAVEVCERGDYRAADLWRHCLPDQKSRDGCVVEDP